MSLTATRFHVQARDPGLGWITLTTWRRRPSADRRATTVADSPTNPWNRTRVVTDLRRAADTVVFEYEARRSPRHLVEAVPTHVVC